MVCLTNAHEFINVYPSNLGSFGQRDAALLIQPQCIGNADFLLNFGSGPGMTGELCRIALEDLLAYAQKMRAQQANALDRLADNARELGLDY